MFDGMVGSQKPEIGVVSKKWLDDVLGVEAALGGRMPT
jgi:hypothetical protein